MADYQLIMQVIKTESINDIEKDTLDYVSGDDDTGYHIIVDFDMSKGESKRGELLLHSFFIYGITVNGKKAELSKSEAESITDYIESQLCDYYSMALASDRSRLPRVCRLIGPVVEVGTVPSAERVTFGPALA